jgi:Ca2+-binding EF-hand superfamily protein
MVAMIAGSLLAAKDQPAFAVHSPLADEALFVRLDANADGRLTVGEIPPEHRRLFGRLLRRADANRDEALDQAEFLAGLVPTRPEKELEEKQSAEFPGADAIRWLLLSMDTNGNGSITAEEVPENLKSVLESMPPQIDRNENGVLERNELNQGGRFLSNMATRTAQQLRIDVAAELAKLERSQGAAFNRFDDQGGRRGRGPQLDLPLGNPQQARRLFQQFDANGDGQAEPDEVPAEARPAFQRLLQAADRDGDGRLSQREFVVGVEQLSGQRGGVRAGSRGARGRARRGGPIPALDGLPVPDAGGMDGGQGMNAAPGDATPDGSGMPGRGR